MIHKYFKGTGHLWYSLGVKEWKFHSLVRVVSVPLIWVWKSICVTPFEWNWNKLHSIEFKVPVFHSKKLSDAYDSLQEWYSGQSDCFFHSFTRKESYVKSQYSHFVYPNISIKTKLKKANLWTSEKHPYCTSLRAFSRIIKSSRPEVC